MQRELMQPILEENKIRPTQRRHLGIGVLHHMRRYHWNLNMLNRPKSHDRPWSALRKPITANTMRRALPYHQNSERKQRKFVQGFQTTFAMGPPSLPANGDSLLSSMKL